MRYMARILTAAICLFALGAGAALAADPLMTDVQGRYDSLKSMKADYTQTLNHKESGSTEKRRGTLWFKKPLKVRWETRTPVKELLIVSPTAIWNVFEDEEVAYKYPPELNRESGALVRVITGQSRLDQDFYLETQGKEGSLHKVRLTPREPTQSLTEADIWVDAESLLIKRIAIRDFYGNINDITFTSQETDGAVDDSLFRYAPPQSVRVEDKSGEGVMSRPLLQ